MSLQLRSSLPYECNQVLHPWHKNCIPAAWMLTKPCFRESFKIYCVLYGVTGLIKLRKIRTLKDFRKFLFGLVNDILQSTAFLGTHGLIVMPAYCAGRRILGGINYYGMYFQSLCCTLLTISIERKQRRGALALYMANLAAEVLFKMAVQRRIITPIPNGEILLFSISSAIYTYMLKTTAEHKHNSLLFSIVKLLIGNEECAPSLKIEEPAKPKRKSVYFAVVYKYLKYIKQWPKIQNKNHPICKHKYHCLIHILLGFLKRFSVGVFIQLILHFTSSPLRFLRHPTLFFYTLNRNVFNLGKFFGFYSAIYRLISCLLRNILKYDRPEHGLLAGYLAGFSMIFYKSSTLAMYMMAKLIESIYFKYAADKKVPIIPWFDSVLYALSTALVFHAAIIEPQAMRPAYYKFLERLTGGHFSEVNRPMMDCFGVCSSKLFPSYKLPSLK
ncbi:unnamed protein product [Adineta steineri]|uniref:Transmembrane protein 135 N-terminal domain-containing protein n=1 Tax=Adineta steineri TaxID=433720 RepID=A0A815EWX5_9BILA|nr:unnamed protein product [Adineta steineri]CAF1580712.1 unnamed protein product [Adineta steineri]